MRLRWARSIIVVAVAVAGGASLYGCAGDGVGLTESGDPAGSVLTANIGAMKDNTLYEDSGGTISNGAGSHFFVGATGNQQQGALRRGMVMFDVAASVPQGATITGAEVKLYMSRQPSGSGPTTIELHRCLADWGEGTSDAPQEEGGGAASTVGDATWAHRFFSSDLWTALGGDFATVVSAARSVSAVAAYTWSGDPLVVDVQDMLDNPSSNFGWMLIGDEATISSAKRFDTRENPQVSQRPVLTVRYTRTP